MITLFKEPFYSIFDEVLDANNFSRTPQVTIRKEDDKYKILMGLPGLTRDDIKISVKEGVLSISYKKEEKTDKTYFVNSFYKSYSLNEEVVEDEIRGKVENGLLTVTVPLTKKKKSIEKLISID